MNTSNPHPALDLPQPPLLCRIGVGVLGLFVTLSALPWIYYTLGHFGGFDWGFFGFEVITAVAGVFAILLGLGKFREGWAIGTIAIAGSILVGLVFGLYVGFIQAKQSDFPDLASLAKITFLGRLATIGAFAVLASIAVFVRNSESLPFLIKSALCAIPIIAISALMHFNIGPGAWINTTLASTSGNGAIQAVLTITLGLTFIILISAAGHLLIRAYEMGRPSQQSESTSGS
ncbi:MAG: hypothetical protein JJ974_07740 [Phycisphaerales bacterium]|nr:hypothetical protein [Phycisphaerales bacterium]